MLIFSIFLWIVSLVMSISLFYNSHKKRERAFLIVEACVWLLLFILLPFVLSVGNDLLTSAVEIFLMGIFLLLLAWQCAHRMRRCSLEINAMYMGYREIKGYRGKCSYVPEFEYHYQGKYFKEFSFRTYSYKELERLFELRKQYAVFIDPNQPQWCIDKRVRVDGGIILCSVAGFLCVLLSVWAFANAI
jgi:hypothetical protein